MTSKQDEKNPLANAAIGRRNKNGFEYWHRDGQHGQEIVEKDGIKRVTSWFVSGKNLAGKMRKVLEVVDGKEKVIQKFVYDEQGRLIRETKNQNGKDVVTVYQFDPIKNQTVAMRDGKLLWKKDVAPAGYTLTEFTKNGKIERNYRKLQDGKLIVDTTGVDGKKHSDEFLNGRLVKRTFGDEKNGYSNIYDEQGRIIQEGRPNGKIINYSYKKNGNGLSIYKDDILEKRIIENPGRSSKIIVYYTRAGDIDYGIDSSTKNPIEFSELHRILQENP